MKTSFNFCRHKTSNCSVPWAVNTSICTSTEDVKTAMNMANDITSFGVQDCTKPCQSMPLRVTGGGESRKSYVSMTLKFEPLVTVSTERDLYGIWTMFAEVGGYVGIFVGYSLLSLADYLHSQANKMH